MACGSWARSPGPGAPDAARQKLPDVDIVEALEDIAEPTSRRSSPRSQASRRWPSMASGAAQRRRSAGDLGRRARGRARCSTRLKSVSRGRQQPPAAAGGRDRRPRCNRGDAPRGAHLVRYRSRKPPAAWRGSPAEEVVDLGKLAAPTVLYTGSAGEAALLYPQNANVAAAVALAGLGFEPPRSSWWPIRAPPAMCTRSRSKAPPDASPSSWQGKPSRTQPEDLGLGGA